MAAASTLQRSSCGSSTGAGGDLRSERNEAHRSRKHDGEATPNRVGNRAAAAFVQRWWLTGQRALALGAAHLHRTRRNSNRCSFCAVHAGRFGVPCAHAVAENCQLCCPDSAESAAHRTITVQFALLVHRASLASSRQLCKQPGPLQRPLQRTQRDWMSRSAEPGAIKSSRSTV